jgi:ABC-2 type transport system permease protein
MNTPFLQLLITNLKEFFREPGAWFWALLFPILMSGGLGLAFTEKGELIQSVAIVMDSNEKEIQTKLEPDGAGWKKKIGNKTLGYTTYKFLPATWNEAIVLLKKGKVDLIVRKTADSTNYHFDPLNPEAQLAYIQLSGILEGKSVEYNEASIRPLTQKGTRYIDFLIPGLMTMGIMMSCLWGTSYGLIDKRSKKLLRRMVATPMKKSTFLLSIISARLLLTTIECTILLLFAFLAFDIQIQGTIIGLVLMFISGNIIFNGIGIILGSRTGNVMVGNGIINAVVLPMMILSGIFFSYQNFPDWAVKIIKLFPLTLLADTCRSIFNEGIGLSEVLLPFSILSGVGLLFMAIGLKIFRWY